MTILHCVVAVYIFRLISEEMLSELLETLERSSQAHRSPRLALEAPDRQGRLKVSGWHSEAFGGPIQVFTGRRESL